MQNENYSPLTLAFLGDIDERGVQFAKAAIEAARTHAAPLELVPDGLGKFGKPRDATLWLGVRPHETLVQLAASLRDELSAREVPFDGKPFKPHVTLARRAAIPNAPLPALAFPEPASATAVTLFKSELGPEGARYFPL